MEFGNSEEIRLALVDGLDEYEYDSPSSCSMCLCRICHEEEEESSTSMESPCACSGTLKFAHRGCIQRWCNEKGSTICEICLQKFEPNYTVPPKMALIDIAVTIRGSLEVPRLNYESQNSDQTVDDESDGGYAECSSESGRGAACFRTVALIFTAILLSRHLIVVLSTGAGHYPFALATVFLLRASGIILPFYIIMRIVALIENGQRLQWLHEMRNASVSYIHGEEEEEDEEQQQHHTIQIHS